jgi:hypothetical protein
MRQVQLLGTVPMLCHQKHTQDNNKLERSNRALSGTDLSLLWRFYLAPLRIDFRCLDAYSGDAEVGDRLLLLLLL